MVVRALGLTGGAAQLAISVAKSDLRVTVGHNELLTQCSIVVTHFRTPEILRNCLETIHESGITSEVIVCDSAAAAGTPAEAFPAGMHPTYIPFAENVGFGALVNAGLAAADGRFILVINADVVINRDAMLSLLSLAETQHHVGMVVPKLVNSDGSPQPSAFAFHRVSTVVYRRTPLGRTKRGRRELSRFESPGKHVTQTTTPFDVDWALGAAMLVRKDAVETVGPMDPHYFLYFEDVDWCLRMWQTGWRVVMTPAAVFQHGYGKGSRKHGVLGIFTNHLLRVHVRSAIRFFRLHGFHPERPR